MRCLIDTHVFLWAARSPKVLSKSAFEIVSNTNNAVYVSAVSAFEIANKIRLGKLDGFDDICERYMEIVDEMQMMHLPLQPKHALFAARFAWEHRDPFDRFLAAQASLEGLTLVTRDSVFDELAWVNKIW